MTEFTVKTSRYTKQQLLEELSSIDVGDRVNFIREGIIVSKNYNNSYTIDGTDLTAEEIYSAIRTKLFRIVESRSIKIDTNIIDFVESHFGTTNIPPKHKTFIMPDGKFLNMSNCYLHSDVEKFLINNGMSEEKFANAVDGSPTLSKNGCFRCNATKKYIILPEVSYPTEESLNSVLIWLDSLSKIGSVTVCGYDGSQMSYSLSEMSSDDIVNRIIGYYKFHILFESTKNVGGTKFVRNGVGSKLEICHTPLNILIENNLKIKEMLSVDTSVIEKQLKELDDGDLLIYPVTNQFGFNKLCIIVSNDDPEYYTIWNENDDGEISDLTKHSSFDNTVYWIAKTAISFRPKLHRNKYINFSFTESIEGNNMSKKYIDTYVYKDDTYSDIELHELMSALKDNLNELTYDNEYVNLDIVPFEGGKNMYTVVPVFKEVEFIDMGGVPADDVLDDSFKRDFDYDNMSDVDKEIYKDAIEKIIEELYYTNKALKDLKTWGFKKKASADDLSKTIHEDYGYVYKDRSGNKVVDLYYDDLHYETDYGRMDWDTGEGKEYIDTEIDYTYTVDKDSVADVLMDIDDLYKTDKEFARLVDSDDYDGYNKYIDDHFDEILDKYYDKVLDYYREDAEEEARETLDPEEVALNY